MPEITPSRFFRYAADHHAVLIDLHYQQDRVSEADLLAIIRKHASENGPGAHYVLEQLLQLGFIEIDATSTAAYEMTRHVANLLDVLLRQHRLTSVQVIQAYVDDLSDSSQELHKTVSEKRDAQTVRVLNELTDSIERLRQDSRNNRDAIIAAAVRAKVNADQASVQERFAEVNRLWTKYIDPLRDMIDDSKILDGVLDSLEKELRWCRGEVSHDAVLQNEMRGAQARLLRLRREVGRDFRESIREISPLYNDLRRDSRLVRGAALALDRADRQGHAKLKLRAKLGLSVWRHEGQLDDAELRAYLYEVRDYQPGRPAPLAEATDQDVAGFIEPDELARNVQECLPIADAWSWLIGQYPHASTSQILRANTRLLRGDWGRVRRAGRPARYRTATHEIVAVPLEINPLEVGRNHD